jgi:hypothetical protein
MKNTTGEFVSYVLFTRYAEGDNETVLFIGEYETNEDVEEKKAALNREMPKEAGATAVVGKAHFYDLGDNDNSYIEVTPKDGSTPFYWGDMIDVAELAALSV